MELESGSTVVAVLSFVPRSRWPNVYDVVIRLGRTGGLVLWSDLTVAIDHGIDPMILDPVEFDRGLVSGSLTALEPEAIAMVDGIGFGDVDDEEPSYIDLVAAHGRLVAFADETRRVGDVAYREGRLDAAADAWGLTAQVSEEPLDFARYLLARPDLTVLEGQIRAWGEDPAALVKRARSVVLGRD